MPDAVYIQRSKPVTGLNELVDEVKALIGNPISVWAVAATIESLGVRDVDVVHDFGFSSVFDLAEHVYRQIKDEVREESSPLTPEMLDERPAGQLSVTERCRMFLKYYSRGLLFSLPMVSQVVAILIFRYSLWAWLGFNEAQATLVAFGTISAFVVTGGFIQVLGRSVSKYVNEKNYYLAYEAAKKIVKSGAVAILLLALFFYAVNIFIPFYPQGMLLLGLGYMVLIGFLLLASGVLYALEQRAVISLIIILGTAVVIVGMDVLKLGIYLSQWIGMSATVALLAGYGYLYLKIRVKFMRQDLKKESLPAAEVRYFINYRYFIYGLGYFLFLFMDRIMAWTAGPPPPPYIMWFNTPYELGMDWALLSMILTIAVLEYSVHAFSRQLQPLQKNIYFLQLETFNGYFKKFYLKQLFLLLIIGFISILATYYSINALKLFREDIPEIGDFFASPMVYKVFWIASFSYLFLIIGLLNTLFFFTLNKPAFAMYAILAALVVNLLVGYVCSRTIALEYASFGLTAGAATFALVSGLIAKTFFERLDYYYYSAF